MMVIGLMANDQWDSYYCCSIVIVFRYNIALVIVCQSNLFADWIGILLIINNNLCLALVFNIRLLDDSKEVLFLEICTAWRFPWLVKHKIFLKTICLLWLFWIYKQIVFGYCTLYLLLHVHYEEQMSSLAMVIILYYILYSSFWILV